MKNSKITGVILAGGENRRFPTLKGFIKINNNVDCPTIVEKNLALLKGLCDEVLISTNMPEVYFYLGVPLIGDILHSRGPMSGIYSSLFNAKGDSIFVIACDMPFVKEDVISFVCKRHVEFFQFNQSKSFGATIPIYNSEYQTLFGVYCKNIMLNLENSILSGKTSLKRFLQEIKTNFIKESDIMVIDPNGMSFVNINTVEDYEEHRRKEYRTQNIGKRIPYTEY